MTVLAATRPMPPLNLHWTILGRPVKPVAFALMVTMVVIALFSLTNQGILGGSRWANLLFIAAATSAILLLAGWELHSQRLAIWGMAAAFAVWSARAWLIVLTAPSPLVTEGLWFSLGWAVVAAGSYHLEVADSLPSRG